MAAADGNGVLTILAITGALREREQDLRIGIIGAQQRGATAASTAVAEFLATEYGLLANAIDKRFSDLSNPSAPPGAIRVSGLADLGLAPPMDEGDQPVRYEKP